MNRKDKKNERGFVLITVLLLILVLSLLISSALTISKITTCDVAAANSLNASVYETESAANFIKWQLLEDRKKYPSRDLFSKNKTLRPEKQTAFIADAREKLIKIDGLTVKFTITDAAGGIALYAGANAPDLSMLRRSLLKNDKRLHLFNDFTSIVNDYVDKDDLVRVNSFEQGGYEKLKMNLPRNGALRFREEILLLPRAKHFFAADADGRVTTARIIAPYFMDEIPSANNILNINAAQLRNHATLSSEQTATILKQLKRYKKNGGAVSKYLTPELRQRLHNFSSRESGVYTVKATIVYHCN